MAPGMSGRVGEFAASWPRQRTGRDFAHAASVRTSVLRGELGLWSVAGLVRSSAFVLEAAVREADRVLALSEHTRIPAEQFDALLNSLDSPDPALRLAAAVAAPRIFSRE